MINKKYLTYILITIILILAFMLPLKKDIKTTISSHVDQIEGYSPTDDGKQVDSNRKIFVLLVGGAMAMKKNSKGVNVSDSNYLKSRINNIRGIHSNQIAHFDFQTRNPVMDSANMIPKDWIDIANIIHSVYDKYDAFILIHGTDTMAYTASALSFMLENLNKTVILTGSLLPLAHARSDAPNNLIQSLYLATHYNIPEVCICFAGYIMRGNRAEKISAEGFRAFRSTNYPLLGQGANVKLRIYKRNILPSPSAEKKFFIRSFNPNIKILVIQLTPLFDFDLFWKTIQKNQIDAIVLNSYGMGDAPVKNHIFMRAITYAVSKNIIVVNCTQTVHGRVDMHNFKTGYELMKAGVISSYDMTLEAVVGKLFFLMGHGMKTEHVKQYYKIDLRGELTPEQVYEETTYPSYEP